MSPDYLQLHISITSCVPVPLGHEKIRKLVWSETYHFYYFWTGFQADQFTEQVQWISG